MIRVGGPAAPATSGFEKTAITKLVSSASTSTAVTVVTAVDRRSVSVHELSTPKSSQSGLGANYRRDSGGSGSQTADPSQALPSCPTARASPARFLPRGERGATRGVDPIV